MTAGYLTSERGRGCVLRPLLVRVDQIPKSPLERDLTECLLYGQDGVP